MIYSEVFEITESDRSHPATGTPQSVCHRANSGREGLRGSLPVALYFPGHVHVLLSQLFAQLWKNGVIVISLLLQRRKQALGGMVMIHE